MPSKPATQALTAWQLPPSTTSSAPNARPASSYAPNAAVTTAPGALTTAADSKPQVAFMSVGGMSNANGGSDAPVVLRGYSSYYYMSSAPAVVTPYVGSGYSYSSLEPGALEVSGESNSGFM